MSSKLVPITFFTTGPGIILVLSGSKRFQHELWISFQLLKEYPASNFICILLLYCNVTSVLHRIWQYNATQEYHEQMFFQFSCNVLQFNMELSSKKLPNVLQCPAISFENTCDRVI